MAKLIGNKKINCAVFISGRGTNLKSLIKYSKEKKSPIKIILIISNNKNAKGLKQSKIFNIDKGIFNFKNKIKDEKKILNLLKRKEIKLVCLAGFMKILSKNFIKIFSYPILNIHPSLLPKYKGLDVHKRVIINRERYTGCTVHIVSNKLDSGKIILQKKIKIYKKDNPISLEKRLLKHENKIYPMAVKKVCSNL